MADGGNTNIKQQGWHNVMNTNTDMENAGSLCSDDKVDGKWMKFGLINKLFEVDKKMKMVYWKNIKETSVIVHFLFTKHTPLHTL